MTGADLVVSSLKDVAHNKALDKYDENLCQDIKKRLDAKLREKNLSMKERSIFARNNYAVMNKWEKVFPPGVSKCLSEYFKSKTLWAPRFDPRFPNQNQTRNCFVNFVDYQRCMKLKGAEHRDCEFFKVTSDSLCPKAWLEKYNEQLENGSFPVDI